MKQYTHSNTEWENNITLHSIIVKNKQTKWTQMNAFWKNKTTVYNTDLKNRSVNYHKLNDSEKVSYKMIPSKKRI